MKRLYQKMTKLLLFCLLFSCYNLAYAQERTISGTVTSPVDGTTLPGVNVLIKGTSQGTITDIDGNYSISANDTDVLIFSFVGFSNSEVPVSSITGNNFNLALEEDIQALSEVVVIGYGTQEKKDATGSVEVVNEEEFNKGFLTSPDQLIQGRVSGVQITGASGAPGAGSSIRIRGASSIRAGNDPLYVLDGVPLDGRNTSPGADVGAGAAPSINPLSFLNPNDIASISILKDASATAIYGSRGSNGVVIITTKKGVKGKPKLEYNGTMGSAWIPENREYDLLSAEEFRSATDNPAVDFGGDVDAFEAITRTALVQNHVLSYGGATESGNYRLSLSYQDEEGTIIDTGLERLSANINISQKVLNDRVELQTTIISSFIDNNTTALSQNVGAEGDLFTSALRWNPTRNFRDDDGNFVQPSDNQRNPLAFADYYNDNSQTSRIFANVSANINILKGLDFKVNIGIDRSEAERRVGVSRLLNANFVAGGIGNIERIVTSSELIENTLNYSKEIFNSVNMVLLGGYSFQNFNRRGSNQRGQDFIYDDQKLYTSNLNGASLFPAASNSSFQDPDDQLQSFFGRVNFDIDSKYLLTATVRADGSSRFGENNKYGVFPSIGLGWRLSEESFVPELFDDLKLRLGWGITGNRELPPGRARNQYTPLNDGSGEQLSLVGNPNLAWEETSQINIGFDYGFFDNRLRGSIDWYKKTTSDVLFRLPVTQPGPNAFFWQNLTDLEIVNTGVDVSVDYVAVDNDNLYFDIGLNGSFFKNELKDNGNNFPNGIITGEINGQGLSGQRSQLLYGGQDLYAFYLPIFNGFDEDGFASYEDIDGDGEFSGSSISTPGTGDRAFVGSPNPDFNLGLRLTANYKKVDASVFFNGVFGHQVFDNTALALFNRSALAGGNNVDSRVLSSGQVQGDAPIPSTRFLEDADFVRLANLTVGYTFNTDGLEWLSSLRAFVTGQNLFLITKYNGFDPEVNTNKSVDDVPSFGIDYASYPRSRTITAGISVVF